MSSQCRIWARIWDRCVSLVTTDICSSAMCFSFCVCKKNKIKKTLGKKGSGISLHDYLVFVYRCYKIETGADLILCCICLHRYYFWLETTKNWVPSMPPHHLCLIPMGMNKKLKIRGCKKCHFSNPQIFHFEKIMGSSPWKSGCQLFERRPFFIVKKTKSASQQRWKLFYHFYFGVFIFTKRYCTHRFYALF